MQLFALRFSICVAKCESWPACYALRMSNAINRDTLQQVLDDVGPDMAALVLETFADELQGQADILTQAAVDNDHTAIRDAAHRLKSSAASFGAIALSETAGSIEHALRNDQPALAMAEIDRFRERAANALDELRTLQGDLQG